MITIERLFIDPNGWLSADNPLPADLVSAEDRAALETKNAGIRQAMESATAEPAGDEAEALRALRRLRAGDYTDPVEGPPDFTAEGDRALVDAMWNTSIEVHVGPQGDAVNVERERRIAAGTVVPVPGTDGIPVQGGETDIRNLLGLGMAALARMSQGDNATLTPFRDATNVVHDLLPAQVFSLWQLSAGYVSAVYQASWTIKAMTPIPADFADNSYWP